MKNKNLTLLTLMLTLWANCTIDTNATAETTTVTSPDGNSSVTVSTDDYEWISESFPSEGELAENIGEEVLEEKELAIDVTAEQTENVNA